MVLTQVSTVFSLGARGRATTKRAIISGMDRSVYFSIAIPFFFFLKDILQIYFRHVLFTGTCCANTCMSD